MLPFLIIVFALASGVCFWLLAARLRWREPARWGAALLGAALFVVLHAAVLSSILSFIYHRDVSYEAHQTLTDLRWVIAVAVHLLDLGLAFLIGLRLQRLLYKPPPDPTGLVGLAPGTEPPRPRKAQHAMGLAGLVVLLAAAVVLLRLPELRQSGTARRERAEVAAFVESLSAPLSDLEVRVMAMQRMLTGRITYEVRLDGRIESRADFDRLESMLADTFGTDRAAGYLSLVRLKSGFQD